MSALETIRCDGCKRSMTWLVTSGATSWGVLRRILGEEGWHVRRRTGETTRDLCPECWGRGIR